MTEEHELEIYLENGMIGLRAPDRPFFFMTVEQAEQLARGIMHVAEFAKRRGHDQRH